MGAMFMLWSDLLIHCVAIAAWSSALSLAPFLSLSEKSLATLESHPLKMGGTLKASSEFSYSLQ